MESLRLQGVPDKANRKECGSGGSESIERWAQVRSASIAWKKTNGWSDDDALGYTLLTGCNGAALARSVRDKSGQYAASLHLITRALAANVDRMTEPAPALYYKLCGRNGLSTVDAAWAALLQPGVAPGTSFLTSSMSVGRCHPNCFPPWGAQKECKGFHDMFIGGKTPAGETLYLFDLCISPVIKFVSAPTTVGESGLPTYRTLVQVDGHGSRWELPALATVTLQSIEPAGTWGAYEASVAHRTCYTVTVQWTASRGALSASGSTGAVPALTATPAVDVSDAGAAPKAGGEHPSEEPAKEPVDIE